MTIETNYPGVYVKEDNALSLNITSGSTAVPVFVFEPLVSTKIEVTTIIPTAGVLKKFSGWLEYLKFYNSVVSKNLIEEGVEFNVVVSSDDKAIVDKDITSSKSLKTIAYSVTGPNNYAKNALEAIKSLNKSLGYYEMQHYFENGGGACYVYFYSEAELATKEDFNSLANFISAYPDITLIVLSASTTTNNLAFSAVGDLMSQSTGHSAPLFCLVGGGEKDKASYSTSEAKQTAAYYPYLKTSYLQSFVPDLNRIKIKTFTHYTWGTDAAAGFSPAPAADSADGNLGYQSADPHLNTDTPPMTELEWEIKMSNAEKALAELADSKNRVPAAGEPAFDQQQYDLKMSEAEKLLRELADSKPKSEDQLKEDVLQAEYGKEARLSAAQRLQAEIAVIGKIISDAAKTTAHAKDAIAAAETLKKLQANVTLGATSEPDTDPATGEKTAQQETAKPQGQLIDIEGQDESILYAAEGSSSEPSGHLISSPISNFKELQAVLPDLASKILAAFKAEVASVVVSPVAAIAGAYCLTDAQRGVWKAPANVTLSGVTGLCDAGGNELVVTESVNANLLKNGINAIRYFPGKGFTVWGARTMVDDRDLPWRYIPVRRLFNIAERDIKEAMAKVVFEPNSPTTWEILRGAIDAYLHNLWKQGGLFGDKPQQAYFVKIGLGTTMSPTDINSGKMIVKVGMAAVKPAEFIILEFSQKQI